MARMVEHEADAFIDRTVPYWADRQGKIVTPGDTKAEENAWNSMLLASAQAMMPRHPSDQPGDWTAKYRGTDELIFQSNAQAWMQWWLMQNHLMSPVGDHWGPVEDGRPSH